LVDQKSELIIHNPVLQNGSLEPFCKYSLYKLCYGGSLDNANKPNQFPKNCLLSENKDIFVNYYFSVASILKDKVLNIMLRAIKQLGN